MTMDPDELASLIDRELRDLPGPRAPRSLLPRVLEAVAEARRPWYARAWRTWPRAWQAASVVACALFLACCRPVLAGRANGSDGLHGACGRPGGQRGTASREPTRGSWTSHRNHLARGRLARRDNCTRAGVLDARRKSGARCRPSAPGFWRINPVMTLRFVQDRYRSRFSRPLPASARRSLW